jgi:signal transduction histidine kinase
MVPETGRPSPILRSLLLLLGDGGSASDLADRLEDAGLSPRPGLVTDLVAEASSLGLVRVASSSSSGERFMLTSLGARYLTDGAMTGSEADRLRELESLRTELSATIAHELRTPLTAIRTCATLLLSEDANPTPEQHRTLVETIERNADRMQRVVGDILDISRFRAGSIALQARRFDATDLAREAIGSLRPVAETRSVSIDLQAAEPRLFVYGDRRRLEQALVNLISNAVRFSPDGGLVEVAVHDRGEHVAWSVRDKGPGISGDDQRMLFERFFVGRSDRGGPRDGVGLGLPTALAIANAHGGRIDVDSVVGLGSTFTLSVPTEGADDSVARGADER